MAQTAPRGSGSAGSTSGGSGQRCSSTHLARVRSAGTGGSPAASDLDRGATFVAERLRPAPSAQRCGPVRSRSPSLTLSDPRLRKLATENGIRKALAIVNAKSRRWKGGH
ncbi:hypothetical protein CB1_000589028 [Camelus ferus]|nr:hypothetical protein CB1_000589028 [Camelus ferus]